MKQVSINFLCVLTISFTLHLSVLGTYIRTSDGRIFAIRAANKAKTAEESTTAPPKGRMIRQTGASVRQAEMQTYKALWGEENIIYIMALLKQTQPMSRV